MLFGFQWSENIIYSNANHGKWVTIPADIGFPPVLYLETSAAGSDIQSYVQSEGYNSGYQWDYTDSDAPIVSDDDDNNMMFWVVVSGLIGVILIGAVVMATLKFLRDKEEENDLTEEPFLPYMKSGDHDESYTISA